MLLAAGLPLGTMEPLRGDGVSGLTVAVVRVAVESIPRDGDFGSWLMPADGSSVLRAGYRDGRGESGSQIPLEAGTMSRISETFHLVFHLVQRVGCEQADTSAAYGAAASLMK